MHEAYRPHSQSLGNLLMLPADCLPSYGPWRLIDVVDGIIKFLNK